MLDGEKFGEEIVGLVRGYVDREVGTLKAENEALKERLAVLEARPLPEKGDKGDPGEPGKDGKDAEPEEEWGVGLTTEEKSGLVSMLLRKELGDDDLITLPDPVCWLPAQQQSPVVVHNHLPKRGVEKTVVTKHDERGRIVEFERHEV